MKAPNAPMKALIRFATAAALAASLLGIAACEDDDGAIENAGEAVQEAADDAEDAVDDAMD